MFEDRGCATSTIGQRSTFEMCSRFLRSSALSRTATGSSVVLFLSSEVDLEVRRSFYGLKKVDEAADGGASVEVAVTGG